MMKMRPVSGCTEGVFATSISRPKIRFHIGCTNSRACRPPSRSPGGAGVAGGPPTPGRSNAGHTSAPSARAKKSTFPSVVMPPTWPSFEKMGVTKWPCAPASRRLATQRTAPFASNAQSWSTSAWYTSPSSATSGALITAP
ncbi:MAG: hypothetical protein R3E88_03395 [Myxococcota bacterium]